jgi:hypothetical protein
MGSVSEGRQGGEEAEAGHAREKQGMAVEGSVY